jgi:hypothetical protein
MKATFMAARFMKATFRSAQDLKATFMAARFMKATFMERAGGGGRRGWRGELRADIERFKAGKVLGIIGKALDAVYRPSPLRDRAVAALVAEARRVYAAAGIDPADLRSETALDLSRFVSHPIPDRPAAGRSTWQSLARGVSPETDFRNGVIVLLARLHGTTAPRNAAAQARVARAVAEGSAPGSVGDDDLRAMLPTWTYWPTPPPWIRRRRPCSTCAGPSATRTAASTTSRGTCPARSTST